MGISVIPASSSPSPFLVVLCPQDRLDAASSVAHVDNSMAVLSYPYDVRPVMGISSLAQVQNSMLTLSIWC